ncbi:bifunctional diaminohydroxyphosphoribosylaminopyrimidine deaminase/5-amino-6-(5-phosphoribosylamino)uracil reductase RibD [[Mycoplasma] testudinis]|uniref:bifunctional diaminohydroxyphosphoribosylaminopyrimidine deaminase/5-amino-6-(5-phosphoribosylamino)uracil reductase RibD n=1 Tax=[Mycoplasma] testudinis TaxID=33924 RepID=UPI00047F0180|nr:bifunctional diaminohydroxyphosphoribosylaminopyrimidine deaminase/5-amino-6-(5-phosphoribosylamino)uracil reductase RibD [[Mycoplasma] testudinis]
MNDTEYMNLAIKLARKGSGWVNPNPMVGALIVKNGKIIGQGYHTKFGMPHAEIEAIKNATEDITKATLYVTLEPCCHQGKTPPCVNTVIKSKFARVVIGTVDPNPIVAGNSVKLLQQNNIQTSVGICERECQDIIKIFKKFMLEKKPYVLMKYAMTADGKIATRTGKSKWISSEKTRELVHHLRHDYSAIMVGINTVLVDDPLLTCRLSNCKNPIRIICDSSLRTPLTSQVVTTAKQIKTIIATCQTDVSKHLPYVNAGCELIVVGYKNNHLNLKELMLELGKRQIDSVLLEGGATLNWSALANQIVDAVHIDIAPKIFGGKEAKTPISGLGIDEVEQAFALKDWKPMVYGEDIIIESEVSYQCSPELLKK